MRGGERSTVRPAALRAYRSRFIYGAKNSTARRKITQGRRADSDVVIPSAGSVSGSPPVNRSPLRPADRRRGVATVKDDSDLRRAAVLADRPG
jgi:hypothetical protein